MINVSAAQLDAWIVGLMFPLARMLGLFMSAPVLSNTGIPLRIRAGAGIILTLAVLPALPPVPPLPAGSELSLLVIAYQGFIGVTIGFVMRLVFAAVQIAGDLIGLQMGLSFAVFFDPGAGGQTAVVTEVLNLIVILLFLAFDGHLMLVAALVHSFEMVPIAPVPASAQAWAYLVQLGAGVFAVGLLLALPLVGALLITNIAMGILTRAAPQLNLFAIGFPITLTTGFIALMLSLNAIAPVTRYFFEQGMEQVATVLNALAR